MLHIPFTLACVFILCSTDIQTHHCADTDLTPEEWTLFLDREVGTTRKRTTRKRKRKTGSATKGSIPGAKPGTDIQEEEENSGDEEQIRGMTRLQWLELSSKAMHHGYNPEQDTFDLLQGNGNPYLHPMQLPTRSTNLTSLINTLKNPRLRPGKRLFRQLTAEGMNINDLIRKLDERSDEPSTGHSGFTFYPGKPDALHPQLPKAKQFFRLNQLTSECCFQWFFAPNSRTVKGFVESMAKKPQLEARIGQLLGFVPEFDELLDGMLLQIISVYAWLHIVFEDLWALLERNIDPVAHIAPSAKVHWRSMIGERELSAFEATTILVYIIERIIYSVPNANAQERFRDIVLRVADLCHHIESGVMGVLPPQLAVRRCDVSMDMRIKAKFRCMVVQTEKEGRFSPYRYFLGVQAAGTGEIYISMYVYCICIHSYTFLSVFAHL